MSNTMDFVKILPWVGEKYYQGFCGKRVLVLGESHYCENKSDFSSSLTSDIIADLFDSNSDHEPYKNTYTKFVESMVGKDTLTISDKKEFWNSVIFYNYVQVPISGPRIAPSTDDFRMSENAFNEVLELYHPEIVIVWGKRLYNNLPQTGKQGADLRSSSGDWIETWNYSLTDGSYVEVIPIMHPSAAFSPNYWNNIFNQIFKK